MFSCEFCKISGKNFFIEYIQATAFGLSFVNTRKKSVKELAQENSYSLLKRKDQKQSPEVFY